METNAKKCKMYYSNIQQKICSNKRHGENSPTTTQTLCLIHRICTRLTLSDRMFPKVRKTETVRAIQQCNFADLLEFTKVLSENCDNAKKECLFNFLKQWVKDTLNETNSNNIIDSMYFKLISMNKNTTICNKSTYFYIFKHK